MGKFTFIDLFAGIGGFRLALENAGGRCVGFSEINKDAINTYCANFDETGFSNLGDIRTIKRLPHHDLLTAGVPCQSWSIAGKNLGFDDDRGQLWNDTIYLLREARPKAFIFENVKGLADPRNQKALDYILRRIAEAGYYAKPYVINAYDYGVMQHRVRIYIVGFRDKRFAEKFRIAKPFDEHITLGELLEINETAFKGNKTSLKKKWSLSCEYNGMNDYFLLNDIRNGDTTLHTWDIQPTTERQKHICMLLLKNRRKRIYGGLDGNPLALRHLSELDDTIKQRDIDGLVDANILKAERYLFKVRLANAQHLSEKGDAVISLADNGVLNIDDIKNNRRLKMLRINVLEQVASLCERGILECVETRYDFKNTKISTGISGVSRIFMPSSVIYPTLVASDTNDYVSTVSVSAENIKEYRKRFLEDVYKKGNYRKITREEACRIQGFPENFLLPDSRARWMKLIGNSVAVPVIRMLVGGIVATRVFERERISLSQPVRLSV